MTCPLCDRVARASQEPLLIHEFPRSFLFLGDHQYFRGYCVLVAKEHAREMHELPADARAELFEELMTASRAITEAVRPWKLNHASLGNQVPHVHWHIFPRFETEADRREHPWLHGSEFARHQPTPEERLERIAAIQRALAR